VFLEIKMIPTADKLWQYARRLALHSEYRGFGTKYPTVREAARHFKCRQSEIVEATEDDMYPHDRYLGVACWNTEVPEPLGDYVVEAY
jgi:acyl carrier protein phosphodiesterase